MPLYIPSFQQQPTTWRGGQVHEIFRDPPDADYPAGDYRLWIGTATIEQSADYSHFPNAERLHILLEGNGLHLHFRRPDETIELATGESCTFSGERPLHAVPVDGPVLAFNLIYRPGVRSASRFVETGARPYPLRFNAPAGANLTQIVYAVTGESLLDGWGGRQLLRGGDTAIYNFAGSPNTPLCLSGRTADALLLLAHVLTPLQPTESP